MSSDIDLHRLEEDIRTELGRLLGERSFGGPVAIESLEIGPLDANAGDLARTIAEHVADAIPGGAHGKTQTQEPSA